jgi:hypothetical protein
MMALTGAYNRLATETFDYFGTGLLVAFLYLLLGLPFRAASALDGESARPGPLKLQVIRSGFGYRGI